MQPTSYELKYCERCGSLGLRRSQSAETYCEPCGQILINYAFSLDAARKIPLRKMKPASVPAPGLKRREPTVAQGRRA